MGLWRVRHNLTENQQRMASTGASPEFWFIHLVCKMSSQTPLRIWYPPVSQLYNKIHPEFIYIQFINLWSYLGVEHSCLLACIYLLAPVSLRVSGTPTTTGKMIYPEISSGCMFIYGRCRHGIHWPEGNEYPGSSLGEKEEKDWQEAVRKVEKEVTRTVKCIKAK